MEIRKTMDVLMPVGSPMELYKTLVGSVVLCLASLSMSTD